MLINENAASHRNRMLTLDIIGDFVKCHSFMKRLSVFHAFQLFYINSDFSFQMCRWIFVLISNTICRTISMGSYFYMQRNAADPIANGLDFFDLP